MSPNGLPARLIALLALIVALAYGPAHAATADPETPDYLVPDSPAAAIETHRGADGRLQIQIQGTRFDGRRLIERMLAAIRQEPLKEPSTAAGADFDLHIAVGRLAGFNGEVLYDVDLRLARRAGRIEDFALTGNTLDRAKVRGGVRDAANARRTLYLDADDAGAFLRFVDLYGRLTGGKMWLALELPAMQQGIFNIRDFDLPPEPVLQPLRKMMAAAQDAGPGPSRLRGEFTLSPGKVVVKDTAFVNKDAAATMEGIIEGGELNLRGLLVPAVLNDPQDPPCGSHLCLRGLPYSVTGPIGASRLLINPFPGPYPQSVLPR